MANVESMVLTLIGWMDEYMVNVLGLLIHSFLVHNSVLSTHPLLLGSCSLPQSNHIVLVEVDHHSVIKIRRDSSLFANKAIGDEARVTCFPES